MNAISAFEHPVIDLAKLTDVELWQLVHADPPNKPAEEELCRRYLEKIRLIVDAYIYGQGLCPRSEDRQAFAQDAIGLASENLVQTIRSRETPRNPDAWLSKVARNAAIDLYRKLRGRGAGGPRTFEGEDHLETAKGRRRAQLPGSFRSRYWQDPSEFVRDRELCELLDLVLTIHSNGTKRDEASALWIKTKLEEDVSADEIARRRGTTTDDVYHLLSHDQDELGRILTDRLKLTVRDL